jgi:hypothetical protein
MAKDGKNNVRDASYNFCIHKMACFIMCPQEGVKILVKQLLALRKQKTRSMTANSQITGIRMQGKVTFLLNFENVNVKPLLVFSDDDIQRQDE